MYWIMGVSAKSDSEAFLFGQVAESMCTLTLSTNSLRVLTAVTLFLKHSQDTELEYIRPVGVEGVGPGGCM